MASGIGVIGPKGRCYGFFQDYISCQVDLRKRLQLGAVESGEKVRDCYEEREDYFECLHTKKEYARVQRVLEEKDRKGLK